ncbi:MAG: ester cyclase, partial [Rubripirellula sp.]|nr:ester cyclase [Rubripirellula sp.]
ATFSAQADVLSEIKTVQAYADWMKQMMTPIPDGNYELKFFAADEERNCVAAVAVFHGTQTGPGGPGDPTGNTVSADYVYAMEFDGGKICHVTKIWNDVISLRQLGWL